MSPALILAIYEQTERERAELALTLLDTVRAATAASWLNKGSELFQKTVERFRCIAGFAPGKKTGDAKTNRKNLLAQFGQLGLIRKH